MMFSKSTWFTMELANIYFLKWEKTTFLTKVKGGGVLNGYAKERFGPNQFCGLKLGIETLYLHFCNRSPSSKVHLLAYHAQSSSPNDPKNNNPIEPWNTNLNMTRSLH